MYKSRKQDRIKRPAILFANGIGDSILNLPALRALCEHFVGNAKLICAKSAEAFVFDDLPCTQVRSAIDNDRNFDSCALLNSLENCDSLISLVPWRSPSLYALVEAFDPRPTFGFDSSFRNHLPLDFSCHSSELAFRMVHVFQPEWHLQDFLSPTHIPPTYKAKAREMLDAAGRSTRILCLHTDTQPIKMWPLDRWVSALDRFLSGHAEFFAVVVGLPESLLETGMHGRRVALCRDAPLAYDFGIVSLSDIFAGVDSCMLHVADSYRVPSVGLFGPTRCAEFGFLAAPNLTVQAGTEMTEITVEQVQSALEGVYAMSPPGGLPRRQLTSGT